MGVHFVQGESDANATDSPLYQSNLETLITNFRNQSGFANANFNVVQLSDYAADVDWLAVKSAQETVANNDGFVNLIITDGSDGTQSLFRRVPSDSIHFNTWGQSQIANRSWNELTYSPVTDYTKCHDFEIFDGWAGTVGSQTTPLDTTEIGIWGTLVTDVYSGELGVGWVQDNRGQRSTYGAQTVGFEIDNITSNDYEIVITTNDYSDSGTKPSFLIRCTWPVYTTDPTAGYLYQIRSWERRIRIYSRSGGSWAVIGQYTFSEGDWDSLGDVKYFKAKIVGTTLTFDSSPDGDVWTNRINITHSTHSSGAGYITLYNGNLQQGAAYYIFKEMYGYSI